MFRIRIWLVALVALSMLAAACGGDDDAAETTTTEPTTDTTEAATDTTEAMTEPGTIVDVAIAAGTFSTLVTAVQAADLVDTLSGDGPFTVFAPTDDAFAALPEGTLDSLLADPAALSDVLLYHVVPGTVMAADVVGLTSATTAQGSDITISVADGVVTLNDSVTVTATDIEASNGVIHVIDGVLLPPTS